MKQKITNILLIAAFFITGFVMQAQIYPVQVIPQVTPPPPVYLTEYSNASSINGKVKLNVLLTDLTVTNRAVRLKLYIEGNGIKAQSKDFVVGAQQLFLDGGVLVSLGSADLAPYFELQNLQGISAGAYANALPEGLYQYCFEVYDVISGNKISSKSCTNVLIFLNEPPLLNVPFNNVNLEAVNPQNLLFQWTPRHVNVSNVVYEFSLVEIWDNTMDSQAVFLASPPFYQVTTNNTNLLYGVAEPQLLEGKRYAWRVQAKAIDGVDEIGVFANNGYSEIFTFTYQGDCAQPTNLTVEEVGTKTATFRWQGDIDNLNYKIAYRKAQDENGNTGDANTNIWFESDTNREEFIVIDLEPNTAYEWRVGGFCADGMLTYAQAKLFTTMAKEAEAYYNCGIEPNIDISNQTLLETLQVGDVIKAGDFNVKIQEVSGSNTFTGKGYTTVGFLKNIKIALEFSNIQVNTDYQFVNGEIKTVYDPTWGNILDVDAVLDEFEDIVDVVSGDDEHNIILTYDIEESDIRINTTTNHIVITDPDGNTHEYPYDDGDTYTITDASGDEYEIDTNGRITQTGEGAEGGPATAANTRGITDGHTGTVSDPAVRTLESKGILITFENTSDSKYALDNVNNEYERQKYHKVTVTGGTDYYPAHKAVAAGNSDTFLAKIVGSNTSVTIDSLIFKTVSGKKVPSQKLDNSTFKLTVSANNYYKNEEAIVTYKDTDSTQVVLGSFFIHHIKNQPELTVKLVRVNDANNIPNLQEKLHTIFKPAAGNLKVDAVVDEITIPKTAWDIDEDNNLIDYNGSGIASQYPKELRAIKDYYKKEFTNYNSKAYHIFIIDESIPVSKPLQGFMPKTRQWGFLFEKHINDASANERKPDIATVLAHELGHGVYNLGHPFGEDDGNSGVASTWLMDYQNGTELAYPNWAKMSDKGLQLGLFQNDEDNEYGGGYLISKIIQEIRCKYRSQDFNIDNSLEDYIERALFYNKSWGKKSKEQNVTFTKSNTDGTYSSFECKIAIGRKKSTNSLLQQGSVTFESTREVYGSTYKYDLGGVIIWSDYDDKLGTDGSEFAKYLGKEVTYINVLTQNEAESTTQANQNQDKETIKPERLEEVVIIAKTLNSFIASLIENDDISNKEFKIIKSIASCDATQLALDTRFKVIKLVSEKWIISEKSEDLVLDLLSTVSPKTQDSYNAIIDKFKESPEVYVRITEGVDDIIEGAEDNYHRFYDELYTIWSESSYYEEYHTSVNGTTYNSSNRNDEFYREFKIEFESFILENLDLDCVENYKDVGIITLINCLETLPVSKIQQISYDDRIALIERILKDGAFLSSSVSANIEKPIVRLVKYLPQNFEYDDFINYLVDNSLTLELGQHRSDSVTGSPLRLLFNKINDGNFLFPENYRKELLEAFIKIKQKSSTITGYVSEINKNIDAFDIDAVEKNLVPYYSYDYRNILKRLLTELDPLSFDFYYSLETTLEDNKGTTPATLNIQQTLKNGYDTTPLFENNHHPFDLILFANFSKEPLLSEFTNTDENNKRVAVAMPAIFAHYASETGNEQTKSDIIQTTIDVGTLVIPGANVGTLGKLIYYADKVSSIASLAGTYNQQDNPELAKLLNKISMATGAISLVDLAANGYKAVLKEKGSNLKNLTPNEVANGLTEQSRDVLNIIENHPNELNRALQATDGREKINIIAEILEKEKLALPAGTLKADEIEIIDDAIDGLRSFNLANSVDDLASYVNTLMNKNIRNAILEVAESRIVAQKYFNRIKQNPSNYLSDYTLHLDDFDNWYNNVFKSNLFEAHHVIPKNVLRDNPNLQSILDWARKNNKTWDFGDIDNGIMLQKRRKNNLGEVVGDHANHPSYDTDVSDKIDDIFNESNGNMSEAYDDFVDFVNDLKTELNLQVVEGDKIVNNLIVP